MRPKIWDVYDLAIKQVPSIFYQQSSHSYDGLTDLNVTPST